MTQTAEKQPFWDTSGLPAPGSRITREAFAALPEVTFHMEWHDGVVLYPNWNEETMSPAPSLHHQTIVMQVIKLLLAATPGGKLFTAPTDVELSGKIVQPDVFWIADAGVIVPQTHALMDAPELIVEVLSPSNTENDRVTKFDLYEANGVREYWIVNSDEDYMEVYTLENNAYRRFGAFKPGQTFTSPVLDTAISVKAIFDV